MPNRKKNQSKVLQSNFFMLFLLVEYIFLTTFYGLLLAGWFPIFHIINDNDIMNEHMSKFKIKYQRALI